MKKMIMAIMCSLVLATLLSFTEEKKEPAPNVSADVHASENAEFKRNGDVFNNKANKKTELKR
ncbi:MAG: hypothetical protein A2Z88_02395 [Omnitrophica WOR_2 bacterium GWA2_47_8]|nr:MAG: hypothetical protein A2Z88_02395 [Omnitrophica WOR_2 bacterium GWA2_47_8]